MIYLHKILPLIFSLLFLIMRLIILNGMISVIKLLNMLSLNNSKTYQLSGSVLLSLQDKLEDRYNSSFYWV